MHNINTFILSHQFNILLQFLESTEFNKYFSNTYSVPDGSDLKSLPAFQETQVQSLGQEDPLEKEMATHSSILSWRISWTEEASSL